MDDETPRASYLRRLRRAGHEALECRAEDRDQQKNPQRRNPQRQDAETAVTEAARRELALIDHERLIAGQEPLDRAVCDRMIGDVLGATLGLGPLHGLFDDPRVEEVLGRWDYLTIHRAGQAPEIRRGAGSPWESEQQLVDWLSYAARTRGLTERAFNPASPLLVMRLGPGLRLSAQRDVGNRVTFALRRNVLEGVTLNDLVSRSMMSPVIADFLAAVMRSGGSRLVFSGATGSGKTTLARACLSELGPSEHVIVMEDTAEIDLFDPDLHPNVESWEVREPNAENRGGVDLADLVRHSLRHRPDWNVIGEVRDGRAAQPMIAAMTVGVASLTTVHARSASGALDKLQLYLGMGPESMDARTARLQLSLAVDFVIQLAMDRESGRRYVAEVLQVAGFDGDRYQTNLLYRDRGGRQIGANVLTDEMASELRSVGFDPRRLALADTVDAGNTGDTGNTVDTGNTGAAPEMGKAPRYRGPLPVVEIGSASW